MYIKMYILQKIEKKMIFYISKYMKFFIANQAATLIWYLTNLY